MEEKLFWLGFYLKERNIFKTIKYFEEGIDIREIISFKKYSENEIIDLAKKEIERAKKENTKIYFIKDKEFPEKLKTISYAPLFLYVKGKLLKDKNLIAIIGSRKPTSYGKEVAYKFSKKLAENGVGIVSGFARGIDSISHKGTLDGNGYTIGVLGCGINIIYPAENRELFERIIKSGGAIISEFPFDTKPRKENFPMRNRIISGLCEGIVVIEAGKKSGTLITAKWALNQGREVFAIPGSIFSSQSEGTHYLIKEGANVITSPEEILAYFGWGEEKNLSREKIEVELTEEEKEILSLLSSYPQHVEEIFAKVNKSPFEVLSILTELELKGLVENLPGKYIKLKVNL
ncbi:DNA protecting protein DprA [Thermodesulfobacterium geofontis OPF15]|jgi:DNA processing protein|uniref:DNA protecting protein DprA n=1 Tax=Thermodesulfobacterium geofontis (strain OPF15) TaxID=795359 RepID=F8C5V1_THEGP|nr:DNA-processing protein DprA [Thermodesulfobacterium geofontis]AEH23090.1 DNA protecting protein DprA [Thermodesulfobacterium geofontis OPF15]